MTGMKFLCEINFNACLFFSAARYASNNGDFQTSASKLSFALVNVRAILTHFSPKIDEFLTSQNISTPTEEQVNIFVSNLMYAMEEGCTLSLLYSYSLYSHSSMNVC